MRWPTAWLAQQAATCLLNCQVPSIHVPLADGEREAMQREALGLLQRVVAAVRDGVHDAEQAREWLVFIRDDERSATQVRAAEALAELPAETREAWTALWRAVDEVLGEGR